jgi:hypothetical protein
MILVECDPDEFLVRRLGFSRKAIKHESGKGNVLRKLKNNPRRSIGIIDEDPDSNQPGEMSKYTEIETMGAIKLLERSGDPEKRIIKISPYLEHWLLQRARQNQISPKDYGLPENPREMHDITHIERNPKFQSFMEELIRKDSEIKTLKRWIEKAAG